MPKNTKKVIDAIDKKLLRCCEEKSGKPLQQIIKPLLKCRSKATLYKRLKRLEGMGLIRVDKTTYRGNALCEITEAGKEALGKVSAQAEEA